MIALKPFVYIASPYTKGSPSLNANYQAEIYRKLVKDGIVTPFAPLLAHFVPGQELLTYQQWFDHVVEIEKRCDALYTENVNIELSDGYAYCCAESSGRDREVGIIKSLDRPVFYDVETMYEWAAKWRQNK